MSDLISRADAIAYIDRVTNSGLGRNKSLDYIHKYISALPSADAVPQSEQYKKGFEDCKRAYEIELARSAGRELTNLKEEFESAEYEDYEHATLVDIKEPLKVLVVRCKDCKWWNSETKGCKRNPSVEAWYETDFCKYGEKEDE